MDTVTATRNLRAAIREFTGVYENDARFRDVVSTLRETEGALGKLVPAAEEATEESPGKRAAREAAQEAAPALEDKSSAPTEKPPAK